MAEQGLILNSATLYVLDETTGSFQKISRVDDVTFNYAANSAAITTASGFTLARVSDPRATISGIFYNPGKLESIELMARGLVDVDTYDGSTTVTGEIVTLKFDSANQYVALPGYNGDKTAVTVTSVKLKSNQLTVYTVTDDYTVSADPTGVTLIKHVSGGDIPLGTEVVVNYSYEPLAGNILKASSSGILETRTVMLHMQPDCDDATKYIRVICPAMYLTSDITMNFLDRGADNSEPGIMNFTYEQEKPEKCGGAALPVIINTIDV